MRLKANFIKNNFTTHLQFLAVLSVSYLSPTCCSNMTFLVLKVVKLANERPSFLKGFSRTSFLCPFELIIFNMVSLYFLLTLFCKIQTSSGTKFIKKTEAKEVESNFLHFPENNKMEFGRNPFVLFTTFHFRVSRVSQKSKNFLFAFSIPNRPHFVSITKDTNLKIA